MSGLFITGVGTGVGKTLVTTILCHQGRAIARDVLAIKPVVSGFVEDDPESDPALILRSLGIAPTASAIADVAPWRFAAPISPHLAARREGRSITLAEVARFCRGRAGGPGSFRLIEGAGGVMSPICEDATCLDLMALLGDPAVLVTGTYLGAMSHTLTSMAAEGLRAFGSGDVAILPLPRLSGVPESRWRSAPSLLRLCEVIDE
jgi:dethiobiotin synthetase